MKRWINEFIHNCIIHPTLPFMPLQWSIKLHDWHAALIWDDFEIKSNIPDDVCDIAKYVYSIDGIETEKDRKRLTALANEIKAKLEKDELENKRNPIRTKEIMEANYE